MKGYALILGAAALSLLVVLMAGRIPEAGYTMDWIVLRPFDLSIKSRAVSVGVAGILVGMACYVTRRTATFLPPGFTAFFVAGIVTMAALNATSTPGLASAGLALNAGMQAAMTVIVLQLLRGRPWVWALLASLPFAALIPLTIVDGRLAFGLVPQVWNGETLAQVFKQRTYGVSVFAGAALNLFVLTILLSLAYFDTDHGASENASTSASTSARTRRG